MQASTVVGGAAFDHEVRKLGRRRYIGDRYHAGLAAAVDRSAVPRGDPDVLAGPRDVLVVRPRRNLHLVAIPRGVDSPLDGRILGGNLNQTGDVYLRLGGRPIEQAVRRRHHAFPHVARFSGVGGKRRHTIIGRAMHAILVPLVAVGDRIDVRVHGRRDDAAHERLRRLRGRGHNLYHQAIGLHIAALRRLRGVAVCAHIQPPRRPVGFVGMVRDRVCFVYAWAMLLRRIGHPSAGGVATDG